MTPEQRAAEIVDRLTARGACGLAAMRPASTGPVFTDSSWMIDRHLSAAALEAEIAEAVRAAVFAERLEVTRRHNDALEESLAAFQAAYDNLRGERWQQDRGPDLGAAAVAEREAMAARRA